MSITLESVESSLEYFDPLRRGAAGVTRYLQQAIWRWCARRERLKIHMRELEHGYFGSDIMSIVVYSRFCSFCTGE